jgi:hypothetical protein
LRCNRDLTPSQRAVYFRGNSTEIPDDVPELSVKALWIRVSARKASSLEIIRFAAELGIPRVHALGHYVALGGEIAEALPDGNIANVPDDALECWADWTGERGKLAAAVRCALQSPDGQFDGWSETMGKLVEMRQRDRDRKANGNSTEIPPKSDGASVETPAISGATGRNGTGRNGTGRNGKRRNNNTHGTSDEVPRVRGRGPVIGSPTFEATWSVYPRRMGSNPKRPALEEWNARVAEGVTEAELAAGVDRYITYCEFEGMLDTRHVMQGKTFFGPDENWKEVFYEDLLTPPTGPKRVA